MTTPLSWEYRPAAGGAAAHWVRQPDDFERAVAAAGASWPHEAPRVPADVARAADLLRRFDSEERAVLLCTPEGEIYRLQRLAQSEEPGITGPVVRLSPEEPDARVLTFGDREPEPDELAALLVWCAEGGAAVPITPEAWRALATSHPIAERLRADLGRRCAVYEAPPDLTERLTGGHTGDVRSTGAHRVALLTVDWDRELDARDWELYFWLEGSDSAWRAVQALVPPLPFLGRLTEGQLSAANAGEVAEVVHTLHTVHRNIPLGTLATVARQLDALGLPHHLRQASPQEVPVEGANPEDYGIFATENGLLWRHPPLTMIAAPDLAMLALGPQREVIPPELVGACKRALEAEATGADAGLYWWQLGVEMGLAKLFEPVRLHDALRWAEADPRRLASDDAARWVDGLLTLGEATLRAQGPLASVLAMRLARIVGAGPGVPAARGSADTDTGDDVAAAPAHPVSRCLRLTAARDRKALLPALGLAFASLPMASVSVRATVAPSVTVRASSRHAAQDQEVIGG